MKVTLFSVALIAASSSLGAQAIGIAETYANLATASDVGQWAQVEAQPAKGRPQSTKGQKNAAAARAYWENMAKTYEPKQFQGSPKKNRVGPNAAVPESIPTPGLASQESAQELVPLDADLPDRVARGKTSLKKPAPTPIPPPAPTPTPTPSLEEAPRKLNSLHAASPDRVAKGKTSINTPTPTLTPIGSLDFLKKRQDSLEPGTTADKKSSADEVTKGLKANSLKKKKEANMNHPCFKLYAEVTEGNKAIRAKLAKIKTGKPEFAKMMDRNVSHDETAAIKEFKNVTDWPEWLNKSGNSDLNPECVLKNVLTRQRMYSATITAGAQDDKPATIDAIGADLDKKLPVADQGC